MARTTGAVALTLALAGCTLPGMGSGSSSGTTAPQATTTYRDPKYHFSFKYPASWKVPRAGQTSSAGGTPTYELPITPAISQVDVRITVDQNLQDYSTIPEGKIAPDPQGGPDTFHYHHLQVAGWPSIQIERYSGTTVDEIDTITNTHDNSYDVRMLAGQPPFPQGALNGYHTIIQTLKLPF